MPLDVNDLVAFYSSPLGDVSRRLIGRVLRVRWDNCARLSILALGYGGPYLERFRDEAQRVLAFMPAEQGVVNWPASGRSASALVDPDMLPLPDASIDRVLVVHALETAEHPGAVLEEVWRVLDAGRADDRGGAVAARRLGARRRHAVRPGPALFEGAVARSDARGAVLADLLGRGALRTAVPAQLLRQFRAGDRAPRRRDRPAVRRRANRRSDQTGLSPGRRAPHRAPRGRRSFSRGSRPAAHREKGRAVFEIVAGRGSCF